MYSSKLNFNSIVIGFVVILLINDIVAALGRTSPERVYNYRLKRSFYDTDCKGIYDKTIYAKVYQVCEDCYNLMREQKLHISCQRSCFSNSFFKGCLEMLHMKDQMTQYEEYIMKLKGLES